MTMKDNAAKAKSAEFEEVSPCTLESAVSIPELMARIRSDIMADGAVRIDKRPQFSPQKPSDTAARKAGELLYSEELRYLNMNYMFGPGLNLDAVQSHRGWFIGKIIVKAKRKLLNVMWNLLRDYFAAEREYQANLVRYLNDVAKYVDARDAGNFWDLIKKLDVDITRALDRVERVADEQMAALRSSERRLHDELNKTASQLLSEITALQSMANTNGERLATTESVAKGLEAIVARISQNKSAMSIQGGSDIAPTSCSSTTLPDYSYLLLENRYRGSEEAIKERQSWYPSVFAGSSLEHKVLEIGPGRGELLELFREQGVQAFGVDIDAAMVECCREKGLESYHGDALANLRGLPDKSLHGVIALQVVEHLTRGQLHELFSLVSAKVRSGGTVVFETINPRSLLALSSNYFRDPTHVWPLHPDTLEYSMSLSGLKTKEIKFLAPVPDTARLAPLPRHDFMTPGQQSLVEGMNKTIGQLNEFLYGYQDYCIIATVQ
jgi:2-polyprenyl-3-methyl-5-hydroxy-6-metoxy-1,4-benzoquinol methylase